MKSPLLFSAALLSTAALSAQDKKPNIIFIMCDDLGYSDIGCYGQQLIETPCLDRMAQEGMRFTQAYAGAPVSAPSRNCLMTGQHGGHAAIRGNKELWEGSVQYGICTDYAGIGQASYDTAHVILPEIMKDAGYATGMFGKWAAGPDHDAPPFYRYLPEQHGIDEFYGYICQFQAHLYYPNFLNRYNPQLGDMFTTREELTGNTSHAMFGNDYANRTDYSAQLIHDHAMAWLRQRAEEPDKPFFGLFTYTLPHAELYQPHDSVYQHYEALFPTDISYNGDAGSRYNPTRHGHADFAAMVARLDLYVGQVLDYLRQTGLDENTLVIFTSDNGPHNEGGADPVFFNRSKTLRGLKRSIYEGGMREPFIAWWPGKVPAGTTNTLITAFYDMLPTFAEMAGIPDATTRYLNHEAEGKSTLYFDNYHDTFDGISILPSLLGRDSEQEQHDFIYWEMTESDVVGVRQGPWKLVCSRGTSELYNLESDLHEDHNLKSLYPDIHDRLVDIALREHTDNKRFRGTLPTRITPAPLGPTSVVTYEATDSEGRLLATSRQTAEIGKAYPQPAFATYCSKDYYRLEGVPTTNVGERDTTIALLYTPNFPFLISPDLQHAHWYNLFFTPDFMPIYYNGATKMPLAKKTLTPDESRSAKYLWCFTGNAFEGLLLSSAQTHREGALTPDSVLTSSTTMTGTNGGGSFPVLRRYPFVAGARFSKGWFAEKSTDIAAHEGFYLGQIEDHANRLNLREGYLSYWTQGAGKNSTFTVEYVGPESELLTAIAAPQSAEAATPVYDLQGRRLAEAPRKGLYIEGGKKKTARQF